ncbi:MAG: alpha/beta hydrolase [Planctomycetaceae bacterium]
MLRRRMFLKNLFLGLIVWGLTANCASVQGAETFPGTATEWHGFPKYVFKIKEREVTVVTPKQVAEGRPWVWHGEFFGHKPAPDIALLEQGYHIVYLRVPDMLGSPNAVGHWNDCYAELTKTYGLAEKVALVGLSRGGLYCYNWAIANPKRVACLYGDAPVCDFKSWPGGRGKGKGSPRDWALVLKEWKFPDDAAAMAYTGNPVDNLKPLADAKVPLLHVFGDADDVVPWEENTGLIADRYQALGGSIELIRKPGVGHHPHGLEDSTPIVEFIKKHSQPVKKDK